LLLQQEAPMLSMNLSTSECHGRAVVALRGELGETDAASVAAALAGVAARTPEIIVDLAGLEFIDSSGLAALVLARVQARQAGGDLLLAAPRDQVLRVLGVIRLAEVFSVHASVEQAAGRSRRAAVPVPERRLSKSVAPDPGSYATNSRRSLAGAGVFYPARGTAPTRRRPRRTVRTRGKRFSHGDLSSNADYRGRQIGRRLNESVIGICAPVGPVSFVGGSAEWVILRC
jgi:anti-sigma B factor antagonist